MSKPRTNTFGAMARYSMRILMTGSSGQLGAATAKQLKQEHELIGIDVIPGRRTQWLVSITDLRTIFQLAWEVDGIIHVASFHQPHIATCSVQVFIETNVLGTLTLLEAAAQVGIEGVSSILAAPCCMAGRLYRIDRQSGSQKTWCHDPVISMIARRSSPSTCAGDLP